VLRALGVSGIRTIWIRDQKNNDDSALSKVVTCVPSKRKVERHAVFVMAVEKIEVCCDEDG